MQYGQFCPISKAAEVLGDKWSLLIVRELLMGASRFNNLLRGLSSISPTMLTKRLLLVGQSALTKNISRWLRPSIFDGIPPADEIRHDSMMGAGI